MAEKPENLLAKPRILEGGEEVSIAGISQEIKSKNQKKKMEKSQEEVLTAQKEFDKAEARLRKAKIDAEDEPEEETLVTEEKIKEVEPPLKEENYLTIEQLSERKELIKQKDQEIEEAKMQRDDMLQEEDMKKLSQMLGKEPSTSPTIAEKEASNDIIPPSQKGSGMITLKNETKLTEERECPICKGKLIKKNNVMNTGNGIFVVERTICSNSSKGLNFWKKITCTYSKNIAERID